MPRLTEMARDQVEDPYILKLYTALFGERDPVAEPGTATGTPGNWWTVFAQVPDAFKHTTEGFGFYRSKNRKLPDQLRELGQTRAGYLVGSRFVYSQHMKAARFSGLTEDQVQAIDHWNVADCFDAKERAVLAYTDALVLQYGRVPDAVFDALKQYLSETEIIELTYITCTYMMHGVMSRALRLEYDDVDDPVSEVPAPEGATADVMGMVDKREK
ncbi:carboxymuconolactone decarboxylase family protein [Sphingorhabdus arenilitoris]|uniref:Carboxymuconolactone decarboxylase family protein n=1 Tax=Sphingorhabdus arenilitoris TaxID=1490041 RepID=A0ABV8RIS8_9SPHN